MLECREETPHYQLGVSNLTVYIAADLISAHYHLTTTIEYAVGGLFVCLLVSICQHHTLTLDT